MTVTELMNFNFVTSLCVRPEVVARQHNKVVKHLWYIQPCLVLVQRLHKPSRSFHFCDVSQTNRNVFSEV